MAACTVSAVDPHVIESRAGELDGIVAGRAILRRRQVVGQFADGDHVVVTALTATGDAGMIVGAGGESAWRVADAAVLEGRHVIQVLARGGHTVARRTVVDDPRVIEHHREVIRIVADAAVLHRCRVTDRFSRRADTVAIGVAGLAGLNGRLDQTVIEHAAQTEGAGHMTGAAVDIGHRVTGRLSQRVDAMAGITAVAQHVRAGMIRERIAECRRIVTLTTLGSGIGVGWNWRLTQGYRAVVAIRAGPDYAGVIEAAVQGQIKKADCAMAGVALLTGFDV